MNCTSFFLRFKYRLSAAVCRVTESVALAGIKARTFIRNLIGVVEEICDHPHEFVAKVNALLAGHFPASRPASASVLMMINSK